MQAEMHKDASFEVEHGLTQQESDQDDQDGMQSTVASGDEELFQDDISEPDENYFIASEGEMSEYEENQDMPAQEEGSAVEGPELCEECCRITLETLTTRQIIEHHLSFKGLIGCSRTCNVCLLLLEKIMSSADDIPLNSPIQLLYRSEHGGSKLRVTHLGKLGSVQSEIDASKYYPDFEFQFVISLQA
jgi:hypothetical protein